MANVFCIFYTWNSISGKKVNAKLMFNFKWEIYMKISTGIIQIGFFPISHRGNQNLEKTAYCICS